MAYPTGTRVRLINGATGTVERVVSGEEQAVVREDKVWFNADAGGKPTIVVTGEIDKVLDESTVELIEVLPAHSQVAHHVPEGTTPSEYALRSLVESPRHYLVGS